MRAPSRLYMALLTGTWAGYAVLVILVLLTKAPINSSVILIMCLELFFTVVLVIVGRRYIASRKFRLVRRQLLDELDEVLGDRQEYHAAKDMGMFGDTKRIRMLDITREERRITFQPPLVIRFSEADIERSLTDSTTPVSVSTRRYSFVRFTDTVVKTFHVAKVADIEDEESLEMLDATGRTLLGTVRNLLTSPKEFIYATTDDLEELLAALRSYEPMEDDEELY